MSQKTKILFPLDFSEFSLQAYETAEYLAKVYKAELFLLHVIEAPTGPMKMFSGFSEDEARKKVDKMLDEFIAKHDNDEIIYNKMIKIGKPHRAIREAAMDITANAIVMGTHGASGMQEYLVGSNAGRVVRNAPCTVITLRNKPDHLDFKKILLPLDLTQETGEKVNLGIEFAEHFGSELHLMSVLQTNDPEVHKRLEKRLQKAKDFIKEHNILVQAELVVSKDPIAEVVVDYAKNMDADLICIMTQQELNFREQFLGSNAEHIVNHSPIPVVSLKPKKEYKKRVYSSSHFG